jgi:hypothetical protein
MNNRKRPSPPALAADAPRVFVSCTWENDGYRLWIKHLAVRLRQDGIDLA